MLDKLFGTQEPEGTAHEHPGGDQPHRHAEGDELATHATGEHAPADAEDRRTVQLREEELQARKQSVEAGQLRVGKEVVSEQRSMDVPVTREEVVVERRPVDRRPADRPVAEGETLRVPVREEQVTVEKQPVVYEEVGVDKRTAQETKEVSGTVRREEARIDKAGDVESAER